jgi:hypothetical protein
VKALWRAVTALGLMTASLPTLAIECMAPGPDTVPVLVLQRVDAQLPGADEDELVDALRKRLLAGGKYRVALPDQYRYALENHRIDRCTPVFGLKLRISMDKSDPGAKFGLGGFVTRVTFEASTDVTLLPSDVTLDSFTLKDKADAVVSGKKAGEAFERLFENIAKEIEARREGWLQSKVPGF